MQSKKIITDGKLFFRSLRKNEIKNRTKEELAKELGVSFPKLIKLLKDLTCNGVIIEDSKEKLIPNPNYASFAGIYITDDFVELSVIDFSGKEIYHNSKSFYDAASCVESLVEILRFKELQNVKCVAICSDNYLESTTHTLNQYLLITDDNMRNFIPEGIEIYFEKVCVTNSWKWIDTYFNLEDHDLNVIISFYMNDCYYTIVKDGSIIQKRKCCDIVKEKEVFYKDVIFPILKFISPDNIIIIKPYEENFDFIENNLSELSHKSIMDYYTVTRNFESMKRNPNGMIAEEINPPESAALYAMYKYYGWA